MIVNIISNISNVKVTGIIENTKFLLFLLSSDTNLEIAVGSPKDAMEIKSEKVGRTSIYIPRPSRPNFLDIITLINILIILVITLPINNIKVDFKRLFFINSPLNYMNLT